MDKKTLIALALATLEALPSLIQLTSQAANLINQTVKTIKDAQAEDRELTDAEWEASNALIEELIEQRNKAVENED